MCNVTAAPRHLNETMPALESVTQTLHTLSAEASGHSEQNVLRVRYSLSDMDYKQ